MTKGAILVIDNILETARRIKNILMAEGYLVSTASNSDLAISIANDIKPSLIFVSLSMQDGLDICRKIHSLPAFAKTPIIVLTSEEKGLKARYDAGYGIVDSIDKSSSPEDLILKTETVLSIKGITEYEPLKSQDILKQIYEEEPSPAKDIKSKIPSEEDFIPLHKDVERLIDQSFEPKSEVPLTEDLSMNYRPIQKRKRMLFVPLIIIVVLLISAGIYILWQKTGIKVQEPKIPAETQPEPPSEKVIVEPEKKGPFYSAQVGAFKEIDNAEALVKSLKDKGYDAFIQSITKDNQKINKVLVGKFEDKKKAEELISTFKSKEKTKAIIFISE